MTVREELSKELEQVPDSLIEQILDFCLFLKQRKIDNTIEQNLSQNEENNNLLVEFTKLSEASFYNVWDNLDDAEYDKL